VDVLHWDPAPDEAAPAGDVARDADANAVLESGQSGLATWDYDLTTGRVSLPDIWPVLLGSDRRPTSTTIRELTTLVPEEDRPKVKHAIIKTATGSGISRYHVTHRVTKSNGAIFWILSEGKVV
jgi:hypothetical protein